MADDRSEADIAQGLKERLTTKLHELCEIMNDISTAGFEGNFNVGRSPPHFKYTIQVVAVSKVY